jgi:hypothetical protein
VEEEEEKHVDLINEFAREYEGKDLIEDNIIYEDEAEDEASEF